jgi:hypothetical protein
MRFSYSELRVLLGDPRQAVVRIGMFITCDGEFVGTLHMVAITNYVEWSFPLADKENHQVINKHYCKYIASQILLHSFFLNLAVVKRQGPYDALPRITRFFNGGGL